MGFKKKDKEPEKEVKKEDAPKKKVVKQEVEEEKLEDKVESDNIINIVESKLSLEEIEKAWGNILLAVKPFNHSVEAFLRAARPKSIMGNSLILEVFYPFHKDRLEEAKNRKIVENGLTKVFGVDLCFECTLAKIKKKPLVINNDTPEEKISEKLVEENKQDLYDVAKEIFG